MIETLQAYLTLNDIQPAQPFLAAGQLIIDNPTKKVVSLAHKGYVLQWFHEFVNGKLSLEEFMLMWDEGSQRKIYPIVLIDDLEVYLTTTLSVDPKRFEDAIVVVDQEVSEETEHMLGKWALLVTLP